MTLLWILVGLLLLTLAPALWRVMHGPTRTDRLLAVQLFGTTGAAALLLLAPLTATPALREVALILALLAAVLSAALVQFLRGSADNESLSAENESPSANNESLSAENESPSANNESPSANNESPNA